MKFGQLQSKVEKLSSFNKILILFSVVQLFANLILAGLFYWVEIHKEVIVTPAVIDNQFEVSDATVDSSYLQQMGLYFLFLRFNVNPQNVAMQQSILGQYLAPEIAPQVEDILVNEQNAIISNKISSQFYLSSIDNVDPANLTFQATGTLQKTVGTVALPPEKETYLIKFSYHYGRLQIIDFEEPSNATNS